MKHRQPVRTSTSTLELSLLEALEGRIARLCVRQPTSSWVDRQHEFWIAVDGMMLWPHQSETNPWWFASRLGPRGTIKGWKPKRQGAGERMVTPSYAIGQCGQAHRTGRLFLRAQITKRRWTLVEVQADGTFVWMRANAQNAHENDVRYGRPKGPALQERSSE